MFAFLAQRRRKNIERGRVTMRWDYNDIYIYIYINKEVKIILYKRWIYQMPALYICIYTYIYRERGGERAVFKSPQLYVK